MSRPSIFFVSVLLFIAVAASAQSLDSASRFYDKLTVGVGAGYDFGGYGANVTYYPQRSVGIFGAVGYAQAGVGYNFGVKLRALTNQSTTLLVPFVIGMYGYYAEASPKYYAVYNKIFNGFTAGAGLDYRPAHSKFGYLTVTILVPFRPDDPQRYIDDLSLRRGIDYKNHLRSVTASIGYKFIIFK